MRETKIQNGIRVGVSHGDVRVWRNNVGEAAFPRTAKAKKIVAHLLRTGDMARVKFGLCPGSSDLVGYKTIKITEDMVGREVAVFTALEVKTADGKATSQQLKFLELINYAGGIARIARTLDDARFWLKAGPPALWSTQAQEGEGPSEGLATPLPEWEEDLRDDLLTHPRSKKLGS